MFLDAEQSVCSSCISNVGDLALLEYVTVRRRNPLVEVNILPYLIDAIHEYFKEAKNRGCTINKELKECVAERIKSFLAYYNVDLNRVRFYDLRGTTDEEVLDVLKALGIDLATSVAPSAYVERREESGNSGRPHVVATPKRPQFCTPSRGDFAVLEYLAIRRQDPLVKPNIASFIIQAIQEYFKEAKEHGCTVDGRLKYYVAERIRSLLMKHGVDLSTEPAYDLHGINEDVLDVLKMLGLESVSPPRHTAAPYLPASHKPRTAAKSQPSPPPPPSTQPIPPPPMPSPGYKPPQRRRRIKSALAKAAAVVIVLLIALAAVSQLTDYFTNRTTQSPLLTSQQTVPPQISTVPQITPQPSYTSSQALTYTTASATTPSYITTTSTPTPTTTYTFPKPTSSYTTVPQSQIASAQVKWAKHINPTSGIDKGYGTCLFGNYLMVVGETDGSPFLALLDKESGNVINTWSRGNGWFINCIAVGDKLYQDGYFYIGGYKWENIGGQYRQVWYIEKRTSDLSLVAYKEIYDTNWERSTVENVGVNPVTGDVWAVGYYTVGGVWHPLVAILDKDLNLKRRVQLPGYTGFFGGICFDREGNAYVSGNNTTTKFDKNGNYIKRYNGGGRVICIKDRLYLFGRVNATIVPTWQLVYEIIDMKTMERIKTSRPSCLEY